MSRLRFPLLLWTLLLASAASAQPRSDWDTLWINKPPNSSSHPNFWMGTRDRNYTGLAYDRFRDVLYVVNPDLVKTGDVLVPTPRIHIWDAKTGAVKSTIGRSLSGAGGQLPVPPDTVKGGYYHDRFAIYKIDVDDEGRIYAGNLVAPLLDAPIPMCMGQDTSQGPFQIYRWDDVKETPKRIYATLNAYHDSVAFTRYNSEMTWSRWGDSFQVVGMRGWEIDSMSNLYRVDSARILVSGGPFCMQGNTNREVNVFVADRRPQRYCDYRLGVKLRSSLEGIASHGIAASGPLSFSEVWMDNAMRVTTLNNQNQSGAPLPQTFQMSTNIALSEDSLTGTGDSGPLAYMTFPGTTLRLLVCADARPTDQFDPTAPNYNTTARLMDVTNPLQATRFLSVTPKVGHNIFNINAGPDGPFNYVTDVDYKLEYSTDGKGVTITLFLLMSGNGIAAFRLRNPIYIPVDLSAFTATLQDDAVHLAWEVASETDNRGFEVQRSFDAGQRWETIAFVQGRGTTAARGVYGSADPLTSTHRSVGRVQYRLRQIDTDGKSTLSHVVTVLIPDRDAAVASLRVYPNPTRGSASIQYHLASAEYVTISIFTTLGERIATVTEGLRDAGSHDSQWDASVLPTGTYIIRLEGRHATALGRIVIMR